MKRWGWFGVVLLGIGCSALAMEGNSVQLGKALFESTALGSTGGSCVACHPGGKGLQGIGSYNPEQLSEMVNFCIRDALKGKMLAPGSQELGALTDYVRTFGKE